MCGIFADSKVRYTREGREQGKIETIANMISELSLTFEEAAAVAKIPDDRMDYVRSQVRKILKKASE